MHNFNFYSIDPVALVLNAVLYANWTKPRPGADGLLEEIVARKGPIQRRQILENAKSLGDLVKRVEQTLIKG